MVSPSFVYHPCREIKFSRKRRLTCCVSERPSPEQKKEPPKMSLLLGTNQILSRILEEGVNAADSAQQVFDSAMSALGVSYNTSDSEDIDDVAVPTEPRFDPVLAAYLALYAFRSYESPPPASYREVRETPIPGEPPQVIVNYFAYPDSDVLVRSMEGVFLLKVTEKERREDVDVAGSNLFFVLRINESVILDFMKTRNFTLLRKRGAAAGLGAAVDECILFAYASEYAYNNGRSPLLRGSVPLASIVKQGRNAKGRNRSETFDVTLTELEREFVKRDGVDVSRFPAQFRLPFAKIQQIADEYMKKDGITEIELSLEASFIPYDKGGSWWRNKGSGKSKKNDIVDGEALDRALSETIPEGELPLPSSWATLAKGVREIAKEHDAERKTNTVDDAIPQALFIESVSTNTQVWLFHDEEGDLVISFRGTETNEWMDFVTDAQLFLHKWEPGGDIDLEVTEDNSVGVAEVAGAIASATGISISVKKAENSDGGVEADASCVHYGFLSAYNSVRDAVRHGIDTLTQGRLHKHRFYFVGHSLGGALCKLCAADFAFFHPRLRNRISCISYGAPKAGNAGFAYRYNLLVRDSFRIVNDADIVTRMPKSIGARPCERYRHVGRTVLINDRGEYWIEGEEEYDDAQIKSKTAIDPFRQRYTDANALIAYEQEMWAALVTGQSIRNHMENSYFLAMTQVLRRTFEASNKKT